MYFGQLIKPKETHEAKRIIINVRIFVKEFGTVVNVL